MNKILLTCVLALSALSAMAGESKFGQQDVSGQQNTFLFAPYDSSQSFVLKDLNTKNNGGACGCRSAFNLCNLIHPSNNPYPSYRCELEFERCLEACFN